ncbi:MAG: hypothetical protein JNL32_15620, partial [Candidatus Kapabacteria bacterium]|nr:hypothetical protein [Candidatus Kapabacteria bacterium]
MNTTPRINRNIRTILAYRLLLALITIVVFGGCDGGLDPAMIQDTEISLTGAITYLNPANRPPRDSMVDMRVVAFREIPRDSNIVLAVLGGMAYYNDVPLMDSARYKFTVNLTDSLARA